MQHGVIAPSLSFDTSAKGASHARRAMLAEAYAGSKGMETDVRSGRKCAAATCVP